MKRIKINIALCLFLFSLQGYGQTVIAPANGGIKFENQLSWDQIKAKAKAENKYIFIDVFTTWCVPCKKMEQEVYVKDTVGQVVNAKFVSVKVQMDTGKNDNEQVKNWYKEAAEIAKTYKIAGYPSFLFFTPEGKLAYKSLGYQNVPNFLRTVTTALDPKNPFFYTMLDHYQRGIKDYDNLKELASFLKYTLGDDSTSLSIGKDYLAHIDKKKLMNVDDIFFIKFVANDSVLADSLAGNYKRNYLDSLNEDKLCTKEIINFMNQFNKFITSDDNFFKLCYYHPEKIDNLMSSKWAGNFVRLVIEREELVRKLTTGSKPLYKNPDWSSISETIKRKFPLFDNYQLLVLNYQISYYRTIELNWQKWFELNERKIREYPPNAKNEDELWSTLDMPAWNAFLHCDNKLVLQKVTKWVDQGISLIPNSPTIAGWLDTKANLLYKLGNKKDALIIEAKAAELSIGTIDEEELKENFRKMKLGIPNWSINKRTFPN